ncbi:MAG: undecaprenyl/decaprenyl-phosphate alpha-N-acetylglucosaminyl 1-phosphate transferase [Fimbriimonadaceae bacterium]|nr:undecaprenyl/decaprenyl-phosphate alpha-N-acetylglucosaminyl 1-phosphate transferase [Fimbriimonadaceae bacterium]QYK56958.1 MAG: undecaprenyl/decaprenyl-phosphate alpha-N-acetylglucosaminyl 1-phosphate transferase [Fimbriimonadaceae bacterium]
MPNWTGLFAAVSAQEPWDGFFFPLVAMIVALLATIVLTPVAQKLALKHGAVDDPNRDDRRVHKEPTPRWGGMAIFAGIVLSLVTVLPFAYPVRPFPPYLIGMLVCGLLLVAVGAWDDVKPLSAKWQALWILGLGFAVQLFSTPGDKTGIIRIQGMEWPLVGPYHWVALGPWAAVLTAAYIFVVTKTMDTIDGIDGLTAGISGIAAGTLSIIATYEGQPRVALIAAAIAGASVGFLRYNYNPARIFMGTGGAQTLGFLLACLSIVGALKTAAALALFIPVLVFGVPLIDAAVVVLRRVASGQPITQADKRHIHHTLLSRGLNQRQAVWVLYVAAMAMCGVLLTMLKIYG